MAYRPGASNSRKSKKTDNGSSQWNTQIPIDVAPLNSIPPPARAPSITKTNLTPFGGLPAMVFLTSPPTDDEWNNIVDSTKSGVALTGSAAMGKAGPAIGSVDIAESVDGYFFVSRFRVWLKMKVPLFMKAFTIIVFFIMSDSKMVFCHLFACAVFGFPMTESFTCDLHPDGKIIIEGVTSTGGEQTVYKNSMAFKMTQNQFPSGEFSIAFRLPGPVFNQHLVTSFGSGILEGLVKKRPLGH